MLVTLPFRGILGSPDIDVWNHVWGYWWFGEALGAGTLPWHTALLGAPGGGTLYFVDPVGALAALPVTWALGPAAGYTLVLVARVVLAGVFAHALCEELFGDGPHGFVAGAGYAASPFLLCELANGISEVTAVWYVPATLLAVARAFRTRRLRDAALVGLAGGIGTLATFYYGLTSALLVAAYGLWHARTVPLRQLLVGAVVAGGLALALAAPGLAAMRASVQAPDALIRRSSALNMQFAEHNAVDPRVFVTPGDFASIDLYDRYGEPFRHTGYLRLSVLALAVLAVWRAPRRLGGVAVCGVLAVILGLGPFLWWDGAWVKVGGNVLSLPFQWGQQLVPELAITHPLRLSIGAQAVACALAGGALVGRGRAWLLAAVLVPFAETAFASYATWPIPSAPTAIPALYDTIAADPDPRAVLDLPAEVGTTMATSRYFYFQTRHGHPVPYKPDARSGSTGDPTTFALFPHRLGGPSARAPMTVPPLTEAGAAHLAEVYGWIVVHTDLARRIDAAGVFEAALTPRLGPPTVTGDQAMWRLPSAAGLSVPPARP